MIIYKKIFIACFSLFICLNAAHTNSEFSRHKESLAAEREKIGDLYNCYVIKRCIAGNHHAWEADKEFRKSFHNLDYEITDEFVLNILRPFLDGNKVSGKIRSIFNDPNDFMQL